MKTGDTPIQTKIGKKNYLYIYFFIDRTFLYAIKTKH